MAFDTAHALLIGIGSYAHAPRLNVPITAADAIAVAGVLRDPHFCGYPPEQVTLLSGAAATREGVLAALDALAARVGEGDTVLIYYAGHGEYGDDGYYLTTHDTRLEGRKVAAGTGLREAELIAKLRAIKAKRLLLIVNACHAGEISPVLAPGEAPPTGAPLPPPVAAALLGTGEGRVIISACRENQYSFIGPGPLTLFTQALLDGLQGKGTPSNHGYISVFDLYTHLYFALDEAVPRLIPAAVRQMYGEKQEPELTILKGVGPFAVALYRGATALGPFDASGALPEETAVRAVNPAYSQAMLRQHQQSIGGSVQTGAAIGDVHGHVTVNQQTQHGGVHFGGGGRYGNISIGDVAGRDIIKTDITQGDRISTGDIKGSGIAIGRGAQSTVHNVDTGGGDYAEGNIDKRSGTFVHKSPAPAAPLPSPPPSGGRAPDSSPQRGEVGRGAIPEDAIPRLLNIKSTLSNVSQSIGASPRGDAATKAQLQQLIEQLSAELQKAPAERASEAEAVAETAKAAVEQATKAQPNKTLVQISADGLKQAAQNLAAALPAVLPIATQIADAVRKMSEG
ncbi:MAG: caspase family protein [Oscillochloridaceae bacterium]|nr:caspase family protein [Chloroflexaceae bacterium]MDW8389498.1 caspase family protein [Oscillochloridaceae bacterium]